MEQPRHLARLETCIYHTNLNVEVKATTKEILFSYKHSFGMVIGQFGEVGPLRIRTSFVYRATATTGASRRHHNNDNRNMQNFALNSNHFGSLHSHTLCQL